MSAWQRIVILIFAVASQATAADALTGNDLLRMEEHASSRFVRGVVDGLDAAIFIVASAANRHGINASVNTAYEAMQMCIPETATNGQIRDVVLKDIEARPADRHKPAAILILTALQRAWPCPASKP